MKYEALRDVEQRVSQVLYEDIFAVPHFHRSIELIYVLEGSVSARVGIEEIIASQDDIIFVPGYFAHSVNHQGHTRSITLIIPYNYFEVFVKQNVELFFMLLSDKKVNVQIKGMMELLSAELEKQPSILLQGYVNVILGTIVKSYKSFKHEKEDNNLMIEIIDYIDKSFKQEFSLDKISEHFKYSKYHFSRLFNSFFGCNLNFYVNQMRYNYVISNSDNNRKITDIILDAGFGDVSTFYKLRKNLQTNGL